MPRAKYTAMEKLALINDFEASELSSEAFEKANGLGEKIIRRWQGRYHRDGLDELRKAKKNQHYSEALKIQVIRASLNVEASRQEIAMKYGLRSASQVTDWTSRYNRTKTVTASPSRKQVPKMSRKTTLEERIEVVEYVTNQKHSYSEAAERFQVSYQQSPVLGLKGQGWWL